MTAPRLGGKRHDRKSTATLRRLREYRAMVHAFQARYPSSKPGSRIVCTSGYLVEVRS
jgi:hypothetical protein